MEGFGIENQLSLFRDGVLGNWRRDEEEEKGRGGLCWIQELFFSLNCFFKGEREVVFKGVDKVTHPVD